MGIGDGLTSWLGIGYRYPVVAGTPEKDPPADSQEATDALRFGNYELLRHLGSGGMAEVDLARVQGAGGVETIVVVKRVKPQLAQSPIYAQMFLDEARIAAALQHPNIVQVHEVGKIGDQLFIAMEYVRGKNLAEILMAATEAKRHLPMDFAVGIACNVLAGLHYAHQMSTWDGEPMNIVHRDVSPDNVFVSYDGHVKIVDFGLAKAKNRSTETVAGVVKGTVGYLAPEQFKAVQLDRRLDVFSAGVVLWEMITGHRLFEAKTMQDASEELQNKPVPSPAKYRPECSVALEAVIRRALHKDPAQRYQSAQAFLVDLEKVAEELRLWLSPTRRADVMEAIFPGRRDRSMGETTAIIRKPSPIALAKSVRSVAEKGWRTSLRMVADQIRRYPYIVLGAFAALLITTIVLVIALSVGEEQLKVVYVDRPVPRVDPVEQKRTPPPAKAPDRKRPPRRKRKSK